MLPRTRAVDSFSIDLQPLPHLPEPLFKDGDNDTVLVGANIHQEVTTTTNSNSKLLDQLFNCKHFTELHVSSVAPTLSTANNNLLSGKTHFCCGPRPTCQWS